MATLPTPTYVPNSQVLGNQAAAAKLGVTIPGLKAPAPPAPTSIVPVTPDQKASEAAQANLLRVNGADANTSIDPTQEYQSSLNKFQSQIDSTNSVYADMLNKARVEGQQRLGTNRAEQARGGLLGSDFGTAQANTVNDANSAAYGTIENERMNAINGIMAGARKDAADTLAAKTTARRSGAEAVAKYYTETAPALSARRVDTVAKALYAKKLDPSTLTPAEMTALTNEWHVSAGDVANAYTGLKSAADTAALDTQKTQVGIDMSKAQIAKIDADIASGKLVKLGEGETLYDPAKGVVYKNPKTYNPNTGGGVGGGVSPELLAAIQGGSIDPNHLNSRTLGIYTAIAKAGVDAVGSHAGVAGETKAIQDLTAYKSVAVRTLGVVDKNLPLVAALADKVNTTGIPGMDDYIRGVKAYTGNDPDVRKYINSLATLRSEYAQMLAKGNVATEGDKAEAAKAIPSGLNSAGYDAIGTQLKLEGQNIIQASNDAITSAKSSSSGSASTSNTATSGNAEYDAYMKAINGQ